MSARTPAGFWQRAAAWSLDAAILAVPATLLTVPWWTAGLREWRRATAVAIEWAAQAMVHVLDTQPDPLRWPATLAHDARLPRVAAELQAALCAWLAAPLLAFVVLGAVYHVAAECSRWHGSPGKRWLNLGVRRIDGRPIGLSRALLRYGAGALSWLSLNLGHALAALPPRHLALHDRIAGARVDADGGSQRLPRSARAWLAMLALVGLAGAVWWLAWLDTAVQAALWRALG